MYGTQKPIIDSFFITQKSYDCAYAKKLFFLCGKSRGIMHSGVECIDLYSPKPTCAGTERGRALCINALTA